jgi:hypothetical protein
MLCDLPICMCCSLEIVAFAKGFVSRFVVVNVVVVVVIIFYEKKINMSLFDIAVDMMVF